MQQKLKFREDLSLPNLFMCGFRELRSLSVSHLSTSVSLLLVSLCFGALSPSTGGEVAVGVSKSSGHIHNQARNRKKHKPKIKIPLF